MRRRSQLLLLISLVQLILPTVLWGQERAVDFFNLVNEAETQGELDNALTNYDHTIQLAPKYSEAYCKRGNVKEAKGDLDGALADYNAAIQLSPRDAYAYGCRGNVKRDKEDWDGISQRATGHGGAEPQPIKLVVPGAQANFYVGQAIPISKLGKCHSQELVPTGKVVNLAVAIVASDTATKLLRVNPLGELRKNQFSSGHGTSLASRLLQKTTKLTLNRSHPFLCTCACCNTLYNCQHSPRPDDNDA